jgi:replication-associated recombination protein RarA
LALINQARGGVLFIDEAYSLIDGDQDMYGKTAVTLLMDLMEQHRDDTVVILAGYPNEMGKFLNSNPGLRSRFTTTINFPPYKNSDLYKIAGVFFNKGDYKLEKGAADALKAGIAEFGDGNARNVRNMVQKIRQAHKTRTAFDPESDLTRITAEDAQIGMERYRAALPPEEPKEPSSPRPKRVKA